MRPSPSTWHAASAAPLLLRLRLLRPRWVPPALLSAPRRRPHLGPDGVQLVAAVQRQRLQPRVLLLRRGRRGQQAAVHSAGEEQALVRLGAAGKRRPARPGRLQGRGLVRARGGGRRTCRARPAAARRASSRRRAQLLAAAAGRWAGGQNPFPIESYLSKSRSGRCCGIGVYGIRATWSMGRWSMKNWRSSGSWSAPSTRKPPLGPSSSSGPRPRCWAMRLPPPAGRRLETKGSQAVINSVCQVARVCRDYGRLHRAAGWPAVGRRRAFCPHVGFCPVNRQPSPSASRELPQSYYL